jgi:DNA repair exonuclease SbcCD ATPase subunit
METGSTGGLDDDIYMDAATGTVPRILTPEEKASKQAAKEAGTCDGQMAISLVKANEKQAEAEKERDVATKERTEALEKIATLQSLLVQLESKLEVERTAHKDDNQESVRILKETQEKAEREQHLLKEERTNALKQQKEQHKQELTTLTLEKDEIIVALQEKLKMTSAELQRKLQEELEKARSDRDTKLAALRLKMDTAIAELEDDRDTQITTLKKQMDFAAEEAARVLETTKDEAKEYMLQQVNTVKNELAQTKTQHQSIMNEKNQKIKNLEDYTKKMMEKKSNVERDLDATVEVRLLLCENILFFSLVCVCV